MLIEMQQYNIRLRKPNGDFHDEKIFCASPQEAVRASNRAAVEAGLPLVECRDVDTGVLI